MLPKAIGHLVQVTMLPMRSFTERYKQPLENMMNLDLGQEMETKGVWPGLKVFLFSKNDPTGHSRKERDEKADRRRGGKTILKSEQEWTRVADKVEMDCCEVICGAPMTFQGYGIEYNRIESKFFPLRVACVKVSVHQKNFSLSCICCKIQLITGV